MGREKRNGLYDTRIDSYATFFGHQWAKILFDKVHDTRLSAPAMTLCSHWRGAVNAHTLPWIMMTSIAGFWKGVNEGPIFADKLVAAMAVHLPHQFRHSWSVTKRKELKAAIMDLGKKVEATKESPALVCDTQGLWEDMLAQSYELPMALWAIDRICYSAIFHAYENFVRESVQIGLGIPHFHGNANEMAKACEDLFGTTVKATCVECDDLRRARLVRNALAHNGAKECDKLRALGHPIKVVDGELQLMPHDTRNLIRMLENAVITLVDAAVVLPQFQVGA